MMEIRTRLVAGEVGWLFPNLWEGSRESYVFQPRHVCALDSDRAGHWYIVASTEVRAPDGEISDRYGGCAFTPLLQSPKRRACRCPASA